METGLLTDIVFLLEIGGKKTTAKKFLGNIAKNLLPYDRRLLLNKWNPEIGGGDKTVIEVHLFELKEIKKEIISFEDVLEGLKKRSLERPTIEEALKFAVKCSNVKMPVIFQRPVIFPIEPFIFWDCKYIISLPVSSTGRVAMQKITGPWGIKYQFAGVKRPKQL